MDGFEEKKMNNEQALSESQEEKVESRNEAENKIKKAVRRFFSFRGQGVILSFLLSVSEKLSASLRSGFFGKTLSSMYAAEDKMVKEGFLGGAVSTLEETVRGGGKTRIRTSIARLYERSLCYKWVSEFSSWLIHSYVRLWGVLLGSFGALLEIVFALRYYIVDGTRLDEHLRVGLVLIAVSLPLLSSRKRLGQTLVGSVVMGYLLIDFFGFDEEKFKSDEGRFGGYYSIAFLVGALFGLLSYFISPTVFLEIAAVLVIFALIMTFPEIGMMLTLCALPFTGVLENPSLVIMMLVIFVFVGFAFKFIRGKRVIHFEVIDIFVAMLGFLMLFGGIASAGKLESFKSALLYCGFITSYFFIVNMLRKKQWIYRCIKLIIFSTSIIAAIGIFQQNATAVNPSWVDTSMFANLGTRVTSLFDNPNMLSIYLVIVFPFVLSAIASANSHKERLLYALCAFLIALCTLFTWSRGAWLGIIVATAVFLVVYNIKNIWLLALALLSMPIWTLLLPQSVISRATSIGTFTDSSSVYRVYTWRGVFDMIRDHFFTGIGVGESAFSEVYPIYAYSGTETVMHSHNLFIELVVQLGIVGLLVFLAVLFLYFQKCFGAVNQKKTDPKTRCVIVAGLSSIVGALTMGLTDHIWYNYRVFFLFWAVIALTCALIRANDGALEKDKIKTVNSNQFANLDIDIQ